MNKLVVLILNFYSLDLKIFYVFPPLIGYIIKSLLLLFIEIDFPLRQEFVFILLLHVFELNQFLFMLDSLGLNLPHELNLCKFLQLASGLFCLDVLLLTFTLFVVFSQNTNEFSHFEIGQTCQVGFGEQVTVLLGQELGERTYL